MTLPSKAHAYVWQKIDDGLFYTETENIHAFQIDPKLFKLSVATAKDQNETDSTVRMMAKKSSAILTVNGGFFSPEHRSLGLLMRDGKVINPVHATSWWGIFEISKNKPEIVTVRMFQPNPDIEMALQSGPRLVINGEIPKLKYSVDRRSGIGIRADGNVIIAVTGDKELSMEAFAELFQKPESKGGLDCKNALNLDGGGSTQLYFSWKGLKVDVLGSSRIANAVAIFPRR
ncbi:MAG: phosphodiester glycosidase family protein [Deltaproteobacteria bacterium]|nr:phosphodiester glycosidase family protein [Deltaproteobacteria bacterium]